MTPFYSNGRPGFPLLADDPLAPFLVSIWARFRMGDPDAATAAFNIMRAKLASRYIAEPDTAKAIEALDCAMAMFRAQEEAA